MNAPPPVPCRLFFLLAREADVGVIFRRGPSKWVQIIRWDTAHDTFEPGQWFHGRIYEQDCDLSPSGTKMIYFAQKINPYTVQDTEYGFKWTAISKPPYLTALALWTPNLWFGGGLFESEQRVRLNHLSEAAIPHPDHQPQGFEVIANHQQGDCVMDQRMKRDGWQLKPGGVWEKPKQQALKKATRQPRIDAKHPNMTRHRTKSIYTQEFGLQYKDNRIALNGVDWADWDRRGRLVYVRAGKVFGASIDDAGHVHEKELADFNAAKPENVASPVWARRW